MHGLQHVKVLGAITAPRREAVKLDDRHSLFPVAVCNIKREGARGWGFGNAAPAAAIG